MKLLLSIMLFFSISLYADNDFLEPQEAFKVKISEAKDSIKINIDIDDTIYLYDDKLKVFINDTEVSKKVISHKPINYDDFIVHFGDMTIEVPKVLIEETSKTKAYKVTLKYQGCSKKGLCYTPMSDVFEGTLENLTTNFNEDNEDENGGFLEPADAFKVNIFQAKDSVNISIDIDDTIYLYDDKLKVFINDVEVSKKVITQKPINYEDFIVHFGDMTIEVPKTLIKETSKTSDYKVTLKYQGCSKKGLCYAPMSDTYSGIIDGSSKQSSNTNNSEAQASNSGVEVDETTSIANKLKNDNIFSVLGLFFVFGLLLSLTPCIFPMIPILSSIIVQHSNQNDGKMSTSQGFMLSLVYVLSMAAAYTIAGVMAGLFGANIQAMLQNPIVLIVFSGVFVALAFSLFGYYSLELPQSFQNKINNLTGKTKKGMTSVAIMGFLSALIVGPCVAPPLAGALVYIGQTGDAVLGGLALFVMSLGLGAPLLVVGAGAGKYMPKPGGWMETVSKVFGIVMLALAIYMLERIVDPTIIMYMWAILLIGAALFLQEFKHIIVKTITALVLIFGVIAFVGAISGSTNILKPLEKFTATGGSVGTAVATNKVKFVKVKTLKELEAAIQATNKPVMIDFWASWCVSCKELENFTFTDPAVIKELSKYTLLKVDVSENNKYDKEIMKRFNVFGPPVLVFFDKNGKEMTSKKMVGYKNPTEFLKILNK